MPDEVVFDRASQLQSGGTDLEHHSAPSEISTGATRSLVYKLTRCLRQSPSMIGDIAI